MPSDLSASMAILLIAGITFVSRVSGPLLMSRVEMSPLLMRFLDKVSVSVIAALAASMLAKGGLREAVVVAVTALIMLRSTSALWAMLMGMAVASAWSVTLL